MMNNFYKTKKNDIYVPMVYVSNTLLFVIFNYDAMLRCAKIRGDVLLNYHEYGFPIAFYSEGGLLGGFGFSPFNFIVNVAVFFVPSILMKIFRGKRNKNL